MLSFGLMAVTGAVAAQAAATENPAPAAVEPGEIIVVGERVRRTLHETASSVSVTDESEIEAMSGADRVEQLLALIPNVQLGSGSEGPTIRGQDTTGPLQALPAFLGGNRPRTTLIVDGRPVTYNEFVFGSAPLWDVDHVEVFRSPQSTTQGQNSIAGAILLFTNEPAFEPQYRARLIGGDFHTRQVSALASGPIARDQVALRVAGDFRYNRTSSTIVDRIEGADPNHDVYGVARAKLLVKPAALPDSQLLLTYSHSESQAPQVIGLTMPFKRRRDEQGGYGVFRINVDSLTADLRHKATDELSASLVLTTGDGLVRRLAIPGAGQSRIDGRDWAAETVVRWVSGGPLEVTGGASHRHVALGQVIDLSILSGIGRFRDRQNSTGIFGEAGLKLAPKTTLTAGLRYQRDNQKRTGALATQSGSIDLNYDRSFGAWLPKVSLAYDFTPDLRAGVLVQRAYNPGGTTLRFDTGAPDDFEAETLWDYELFARAALAGGRLRASANLFYYDMRDAQRSEDILVLAPNGFPVGFANLFNVSRARSWGLEADLDWRPSRHFSARLGLGMLGTKITKAGDDNASLDGMQFERAPHLTGSASLDWRPVERLRISAQARHHSGYFSDSQNRPERRIGNATIMDSRVSYELRALSLFGYVRNLFDEFAMVDRFGPVAGTAEDPREIGIGIETRF